MTVQLRSGEERAHEVLDPEGGAARPLDLNGIKRKYARVFAASDVRQPDGWLRATRERCERLARIKGDVSTVAELLASIE